MWVLGVKCFKDRKAKTNSSLSLNPRNKQINGIEKNFAMIPAVNPPQRMIPPTHSNTHHHSQKTILRRDESW